MSYCAGHEMPRQCKARVLILTKSELKVTKEVYLSLAPARSLLVSDFSASCKRLPPFCLLEFTHVEVIAEEVQTKHV